MGHTDIWAQFRNIKAPKITIVPERFVRDRNGKIIFIAVRSIRIGH